MTVTGVDYDQAADVLQQTAGHVKTALVMLLADVSAQDAAGRLARASGFVRPAIEGLPYVPQD
jgi:N-acetylmuramic acid 6-phosphate etherase